MNSFKLNLAKTISKGNKLINRNAPMKIGQRILMYHSVRNFAKYEVSKNIYTLNPTLFIEQMKCLKDNFDGCIRQLEFDDLHSQQEFTINITFDDGFKDNLKIVAPLMEELKIPSIIFLNMAPVKGDLFFPGLVDYFLKHFNTRLMKANGDLLQNSYIITVRLKNIGIN